MHYCHSRRSIAPALQSPADFPVTEYLGAASGTVYEIRGGELLIRTYRGGWLAGLAHNHVISTDTIRGYALIGGPQGDRADLYMRPWDLVLDDPALRLAAGAGFESERSAGDIAATRARMLGPQGLHSNAHPFITARIRPSVDWRTATIVLVFRGKEHRLTATHQPNFSRWTDDRGNTRSHSVTPHSDSSPTQPSPAPSESLIESISGHASKSRFPQAGALRFRDSI